MLCDTIGTMETVLLRNKPEKESDEGHTDSESKCVWPIC